MRFIDACKAEGLFPNCTQCLHWHETKEICQLYKQRPPAKVIVKGCEKYEFVPF